MSADTKILDYATAARALMGDKADGPGVFEKLLGFRTSNQATYKGVHVMNDVAQSVVGGLPDHRGDLLCRVIRYQHTVDAAKGADDVEGSSTGEGAAPTDPASKQPSQEDNRDQVLRADARLGGYYARAFPPNLKPDAIIRYRHAAALLLNFDGGIYRAGDQMASGLASHWSLLGAEGFRRFRVGAYLNRILEGPGRERLRVMFQAATDPVSRALAPLMAGDFVSEDEAKAVHDSGPLSAFDAALGKRLSRLLAQPLSKPTLLRGFLIASCMGLILKVLGVGRPAGRPLLLATPATEAGERRVARDEAVQSFSRCVDSLNREIGVCLCRHPSAEALWSQPPLSPTAGFIVKAVPTMAAAASEIIQQLRSYEPPKERRGKSSKATDGDVGKHKDIYWPERFVITLGSKLGCVLPKSNRAGWNKHLALTEDLLEALVLMFSPDDGRPLSWRALWALVRAELGVVIGADAYMDVAALSDSGVLHPSAEALAENNSQLLKQAVACGIARLLPDGGAEAGADLP